MKPDVDWIAEQFMMDAFSCSRTSIRCLRGDASAISGCSDAGEEHRERFVVDGLSGSAVVDIAPTASWGSAGALAARTLTHIRPNDSVPPSEKSLTSQREYITETHNGTLFCLFLSIKS